MSRDKNGIIRLLQVFLIINLGTLFLGILHYLSQDTGKREFPVQNDGHSINTRSLMTKTEVICANVNISKPRHNSTSEKIKYKIPNIVHYIWYNPRTSSLKFHHMLSILSAHKFLEPDVIYFHTDRPPNGYYWDKVKKLPRFKVNYRKPPRRLYGERIKRPFYYTSHSNVDRIKVLMEYGGIYMDFDELVLRPFDDLRKYSCVIGLERDHKVCGSIILSEKSSFFLTLWINSYLDDYRIKEWAYNTGRVPTNLARRYPHLVHVEKYRLNRPNFMELDKIWGNNTFDWRNNYSVHLWYRLWIESPYYTEEPDEHNIKYMNTTFGQMARAIYYGSTDLWT